MKQLGLRTKLALSYMVLFAVVLTLAGVVLYRSRMETLNTATNRELNEISAGLRGYLQFRDGTPRVVDNPDDATQSYFVTVAGRYFQMYEVETGRLLLSSPELKVMKAEMSVADVRDLAAHPRFQDVRLGAGELRFHYAVVNGVDKRVYLMRVGTSLAALRAARNEFIHSFLVIIPVGVLVAGVGGWWLSGLALRPVDVLRAAAHEINIAQLQHQLPVRGAHDELDRLADTFNETFLRIHKAVEQMRSFSSAIAHELRTPITVMRGEAELALLQATSIEEYRTVLASQLEELERLRRLVDDLLLLARAEAGELQLQLQVINLGQFSQNLSQHLESVAASRGIRLQAVSADGVFIRGDARWLERTVLNLLDNALKFTPVDGTIGLCVTAKGEFAILEVRDTGPGITAEALPKIFDRFFRADESRSRQIEGIGIGLTLAKTFVEAHQGRIEVESELGQGTLFRIYLPLISVSAAATA